MKNLAKSGFYTIAGLILLNLNSVNAAISSGKEKVQGGIVTEGSADVVIQRWLTNLLLFLYLAAVLIAIWGGFNILTASGDEEKVKKGKTILIQALGGIVVIFLAGSIVEWLIDFVVV